MSRRKLTTEEFIQRSKDIHGELYDYSLVEYVNAKTKVKIICKEHGIFMGLPLNHSRGVGCPRCCGCNKTTNDIILEFKNTHGELYDYSKTVYVNTTTKVVIICREHGEFKQRPSDHSAGQGCPRCVGKSKTTDDIVLEFKNIHGDKYDYSKIKYTNATSKLTIICPKHGKFEQTSHVHLRGSGCPKCKASVGENKIEQYLIKNKIQYKTEYRFNDCKYKQPLPFDFYLPKHNICIEYDGRQHYESIEHFGGQQALEYRQVKDNIKTLYCKDNDIALIRIPYWDFDNIESILPIHI